MSEALLGGLLRPINTAVSISSRPKIKVGEEFFRYGARFSRIGEQMHREFQALREPSLWQETHLQGYEIVEPVAPARILEELDPIVLISQVLYLAGKYDPAEPGPLSESVNLFFALNKDANPRLITLAAYASKWLLISNPIGSAETHVLKPGKCRIFLPDPVIQRPPP